MVEFGSPFEASQTLYKHEGAGLFKVVIHMLLSWRTLPQRLQRPKTMLLTHRPQSSSVLGLPYRILIEF